MFAGQLSFLEKTNQIFRWLLSRDRAFRTLNTDHDVCGSELSDASLINLHFNGFENMIILDANNLVYKTHTCNFH